MQINLKLNVVLDPQTSDLPQYKLYGTSLDFFGFNFYFEIQYNDENKKKVSIILLTKM